MPSRSLTCARLVAAAAVVAVAGGAVADPPKEHPFCPADKAEAEAETTSAPSLARADLAACKQLGKARAHHPSPFDREAFTRLLTGTWVRQMTWQGVLIESESALYFDLRGGGELTAMMFDRSNMGVGPMHRRVQALRDESQLERAHVITFLDCDAQIVDRYYKVSNELLFDGLPVELARGSDVMARPGKALRAVWQQLVHKDFFASPPLTEERRALLGRPGAELLTPAIGGALWRVRLEREAVAGGDGIRLELRGEYRGSHVGEAGEGADAIKFDGSENARFVHDGDAYVASELAPATHVNPNLAGAVAKSAWATSCGDVEWERVVIERRSRP